MNDFGTTVVLVAVVCVIFGTFTAVVATAKRLDGAGWFFAGFFFWFIALLAVIGMPKRQVVVTEGKDDFRWVCGVCRSERMGKGTCSHCGNYPLFMK